MVTIGRYNQRFGAKPDIRKKKKAISNFHGINTSSVANLKLLTGFTVDLKNSFNTEFS